MTQKQKMNLKATEVFKNLLELETGEDLFDGNEFGDLSPQERERMTATSVCSTLWEDSF